TDRQSCDLPNQSVILSPRRMLRTIPLVLRHNCAPLLKSAHGSAPDSGMACMSRLLHHPVLLVIDPYLRRLLALTQALSLLHPAATMDRYVDRARFPYRAMAAHSALHRALDIDSCRSSFRNRHLDLLASRQTIQPCATRRPARSRIRTW